MTRNSLLAILVGLSLSLTFGCASSGDATDGYSDAQSDVTAPGRLDLWQSTDAQWHFHLVSGNGRTLLTSEGYTSRTSALAGVLSVLDNGVDPAQYELNQGASGKYNLRLVAANHEIVASSQAYSSRSNATRAIDACVRAVTSYLDHVEATTTGARVEITEGATGQFHFNVFARNGQVVLTSESYTTHAAAWNGAFAVQDAAASAASFTLQIAADGSYYFTVAATNGEIVGVSQMYTSRSAAQSGIDSVMSTLATLELI